MKAQESWRRNLPGWSAWMCLRRSDSDSGGRVDLTNPGQQRTLVA
jgi:hypothetical protein